MFNSITGILTARSPSSLYVENQGIEWDILVPSIDGDAVGPVGSPVRLYTWLYHREDQMRLFGFASTASRDLFLDLMKVEGIGPKQAVKILSSIPARELESALEGEDLARLEAAPGIGKKTAQKMILALRGKLTHAESAPDRKGAERKSAYEDIVVALTGMGFDRKQAVEAVESIAAELGAEKPATGKVSAGKTGPAGKEMEQEIFRRAIVALSS